ncbi:MAG: 30S ribosomal protein S16 [Gammaproteobacteria bacterium]|nr:30S ribosomal protein S16 [Gammaproteobacteria bacterium]MCH9744233.1 30S ribosomal protein S16 [Gammaproteobacteria bacterium]
MVVIRLARTGAKKSPFYHVVATDKRNSRDGRYIERLGYYNPLARGQEKVLELHQERVDFWLGKGAQPSERVHNLLKDLKKGKKHESAPVKSEARKSQAENAAVAAKKKLEAQLKEAEAAAKAEAEAKEKEAKEAKEAEKAEATEAKAEEAAPETEATEEKAEEKKESKADE